MFQVYFVIYNQNLYINPDLSTVTSELKNLVEKLSIENNSLKNLVEKMSIENSELEETIRYQQKCIESQQEDIEKAPFIRVSLILAVISLSIVLWGATK